MPKLTAEYGIGSTHFIFSSLYPERVLIFPVRITTCTNQNENICLKRYQQSVEEREAGGVCSI